MRKPRSRRSARCSRFLVASACAMAGHGGWTTSWAQDKPTEPCKLEQTSATLSRALTTADVEMQDRNCDRRNLDSATKTGTTQSNVTVSAVTGLVGGIMGKLDGAR